MLQSIPAFVVNIFACRLLTSIANNRDRLRQVAITNDWQRYVERGFGNIETVLVEANFDVFECIKVGPLKDMFVFYNQQRTVFCLVIDCNMDVIRVDNIA
jgi:hypothetical protein